MTAATEHAKAQEIIAQYRFGVLNAKEGWQVIEIDRVEKVVAIGRIKHDTSRPDPTLVADVLSEQHDPDEERKVFVAHFLALFRSLNDAIEAIDAFERQYGWQRQHIRECKKAVELAKRNLHSAEQSLSYTAMTKFDTYRAVSQTDVTYRIYGSSEA